MKLYCVLLIGLIVGACASDSNSDEQFPASDQEAVESINIQSIMPLTFQSALHGEMNRVSTLVNEVVPPLEKSYWVPYGERAIVGVTYPVIAPEIFKAVPVVVDKYGPPPLPVFGPPPKTPPFYKPDLGVVISQNYVLKENLRDYGNLTKQAPSRPADEQLVEFAKSYAMSNTIGAKHVKPGWPADALTSFVSVALESQSKTNTPTPAALKKKSFDFTTVANKVFSNGTLVFPSPHNPNILTTIPFMLKQPDDIHHIFDDYEEDAESLIPQQREEITFFLKLMYTIHEDTMEEGRQAVERFRKRAKILKRPELEQRIDPPGYDDPVKPKEAENRLTTWLHSTTVGIRTITKAAAQVTKLLVPVEPVVIAPVHPAVVPVVHPEVVIKHEKPPGLYGPLKQPGLYGQLKA